MKPEEEQLLLKDLCARLPYGVKVTFAGYSGEEVRTLNSQLLTSYAIEYRGLKPYLRPMSSMTEEEEQEYHSLCAMQFDELADANTTIYYFDTIESFDWLNEHHFDYRGLIPKGLALSTEEFNLYKRLNKKNETL